MTNGKLSLIVKENSNPLSKVRKYTGPVNIAKINIKLLQEILEENSHLRKESSDLKNCL